MKKYRIRILVISLVFAAAAAFIGFSAPAKVRAEAEITQEETTDDEAKKTLTITVVEDIPAEEIEEAEVPMAAAPVTKNSIRTGTVVWICVIAAAIAACAVYFARYKKKLKDLKALAVQKETQMLESYRGRRS